MIRRLLPLVALIALAGCASSGAPRAPTGDEAQIALQSFFSDTAKARRAPPLFVGTVSVGECTPSDKHPTTMCAVTFDVQGKPLDAKAIFCKTPNPRHPWRARLIYPTR